MCHGSRAPRLEQISGSLSLCESIAPGGSVESGDGPAPPRSVLDVKSSGHHHAEHGLVERDVEPEVAQLDHFRGLTKRFGDFVAVDGVSFEVPAGQLVAASSTTLDSGLLRAAGHDCAHVYGLGPSQAAHYQLRGSRTGGCLVR